MSVKCRTIYKNMATYLCDDILYLSHLDSIYATVTLRCTTLELILNNDFTKIFRAEKT